MQIEEQSVEGTQEQGDDGLIEITEATDADLEAFLQDTPEAVEEGYEDALPDVADAPEEAVVKEPEKEPEPVQQQAKQPSPEEFERIKAQLAEKEKYIRQRGTEIGELRRKLRESIVEKDALAKDLALDDPREAARLDRIIDAERVKDARLQEEETRLTRVQEALTIIPRFVKPEEMDIEAIRVEMIQDGLDPQTVDDFIPNMMETARPETIIHLAKRAYYGKIIRTLVPELQKRDARIAELEAKIRGKGESIVNGIKKAVNTPPPMSSKGSASTEETRSPSKDPSKMSDAELDEYLNSL